MKTTIRAIYLLLTLAIFWSCGESKKKTDMSSFGLIALLGSSGVSSSNSSSTGYDTEATSAGYTLPNVPIKGVSALSLADSGTSLDIRNKVGVAKKIEDNTSGSLTRYTPTSTTSSTKGTCIWTFNGLSSCIYNYLEGACTGLGQESGTTLIDFSADTSSSTCVSRGCQSSCNTPTTSGYTQCFCSTVQTTGTGGSSTSTGTTTSPSSYSYTTAQGVISYGFSINTSELGTSSFTVQASVNGQSNEIAYSSASGTRVTNRLVLNSGRNYVWITVTSSGTIIARSRVYRVDSTVASSALRAELTWNGSGDLSN